MFVVSDVCRSDVCRCIDASIVNEVGGRGPPNIILSLRPLSTQKTSPRNNMKRRETPANKVCANLWHTLYNVTGGH